MAGSGSQKNAGKGLLLTCLLVVVIPGFQRSKEALANVAIELSRRGIVAILIDPYAQGFS
jgi:hypothetical protein